jgi:hypothetical protein
MGDDSIRRVLWASAFFNLGGAALFAFPESIGRLAGLPAPVPVVYSMLLVLFVLLFGGSYAWIASQPVINRPMVGLAAIGKAGAFVVVFLCWLGGAASGLSVVAITGDLVFAGLFARWLMGNA